MDARQKELIENLCKIILTDKDFLDIDAGLSYINNLSDDDFALVQKIKDDNKNEIHDLLFYLVTQYIQVYKDSEQIKKESLFAFYGEGNLNFFRDEFKKAYIAKKPENFPFLYTYIFDYIQELSEHYRIFQNFYNVSTQEMKSSILKDVEQTATEASDKAIRQSMQNAVQTARKEISEIVKEQTTVAKKEAEDAKDQATVAKKEAEDAKVQATVAKKEAGDAKTQAKNAAKDAAENAVSKEMNRVSSKVSETSVTILGIFAAIVLTAITGLLYSSSVLESVNTANFPRLICIVSFVGLVCYHIIALLFRCIERITDKSQKMMDFNKRDWIVTVILLFFVLGGAILQFFLPLDINISFNLYKILMILLVVGLIVINAIIILVHYLEKIRMANQNKKHKVDNWRLTIFVNILIVLSVIGLIYAQYNGYLSGSDSGSTTESRQELESTTSIANETTTCNSNNDIETNTVANSTN